MYELRCFHWFDVLCSLVPVSALSVCLSSIRGHVDMAVTHAVVERCEEMAGGRRENGLARVFVDYMACVCMLCRAFCPLRLCSRR